MALSFLEQLGQQFPEKPVIVISGYKDFNYVKKAIENGVIGYVLKPFFCRRDRKTTIGGRCKDSAKTEYGEVERKDCF